MFASIILNANNHPHCLEKHIPNTDEYDNHMQHVGRYRAYGTGLKSKGSKPWRVCNLYSCVQLDGGIVSRQSQSAAAS